MSGVCEGGFGVGVNSAITVRLQCDYGAITLRLQCNYGAITVQLRCGGAGVAWLVVEGRIVPLSGVT